MNVPWTLVPISSALNWMRPGSSASSRSGFPDASVSGELRSLFSSAVRKDRQLGPNVCQYSLIFSTSFSIVFSKSVSDISSFSRVVSMMQLTKFGL